MQEIIVNLSKEVEGISQSTKESLEAFRLRFISKKGAIGQLFEEFKQLSGEEKRKVGKELNELKGAAEQKFKELQETLEGKGTGQDTDIDLTLPPVSNAIGNLHPLNLTRYRIIEIFER